MNKEALKDRDVDIEQQNYLKRKYANGICN